MRRYGASLVLAAFATLASLATAAAGNPPPIPLATDTTRTVKSGSVIDVPVGEYADITFEVSAGAQVLQRFFGAVLKRSADLPPGRVIFAGTGSVTVMNTVIDFEKKTAYQVDFTVNFGPPPVDPPAPSPLVRVLQAAYDREPTATRAADKAGLAAVYRSVADEVAKADSPIATIGDLYTVEVAARKSKIGDRLPTVRASTGAQMVVLFGSYSQVASAKIPDRAAAAAKLRELADSLDQVK